MRHTAALPLRSLALAHGLATALVVSAVPALAQDGDVDARGEALVTEFLDILKQPDAEKQAALTDFLADEFQIVRASGAHLDKAGYVANPATVFEVSISDVHATEDTGVLVVSYTLGVDEVIDEVETKTSAPRLSVFHEGDDGTWRLAAHANFGALEPATEDEG